MVDVRDTKSHRLITPLILGLWSLATLARPQPPGLIFAPVAPGVQYAHQAVSDKPWSIHLVKAAWPNPDLELITTLGREETFGLETVSRQVQAIPAARGRPIAAINGDLFAKSGPAAGIPQGLQIVRGELVSDPSGVPGCWVAPSGFPALRQVKSTFQAHGASGGKIRFHLNKARAPNAAVLYNRRYGSSTGTTNGWEWMLAPEGAPAGPLLQANQVLQARVRAVRKQGNSSLASDLLVLSCGPGLLKTMPRIEIGQRLTLEFGIRPDLRDVETGIGGEPILIDNGSLTTWSVPQPRQPRTALGWNDHFIFLVVVDGRQPGLSVGMSFTEITEYMHQLGCHNAFGFDGGGSSSLWLKGRVVNSPSDGYERPVANTLVLMQRPAR